MSKKCPNCNENLPDEASFCMHCFTKISPVKSVEEPKNNNKKNIFLILIIIALALAVTISVAIVSNQHSKKEYTTISTITESKATEQITTETTETTTEKATTTAATTTTTKQSSTKKEATQPSGELKYSSYGNGIIITSYSGNETSITIPDKIDGKTVLAVGERAFSDNKYIRTITFEESSAKKVLNIKTNAFCNLKSLTEVNLPSQIDTDNFTNCISVCPALKNVNISKRFNNTEIYSDNGIVYKNNGKTDELVLYPAGKVNSSFTLPYKVSKINKNSFCSNAHLKKIKFSKRETLDVDWSNMFSKKNLKNLDTIEVYVGTDADIIGIQYFDGEILYYD